MAVSRRGSVRIAKMLLLLIGLGTATAPALAADTDGFQWADGRLGSIPDGALPIGFYRFHYMYACRAVIVHRNRQAYVYGTLLGRNCNAPFKTASRSFKDYQVMLGGERSVRWVKLGEHAVHRSPHWQPAPFDKPSRVCRAKLGNIARAGRVVAKGCLIAVNNRVATIGRYEVPELEN